MEIGLEIDLTRKVSPICMSANADSVGVKLACNVHVWAYFEKLPESGNSYCLQKMSYGLVQISCSQRLRGIVQMMQKKRTLLDRFGSPLNGG